MQAKINGVNLYYELQGGGVPVLFVHGFPLSGRLWAPTAERLGESARLIIPDLRGMGQSEVSDECSMTIYADDLAGLLDAVGETQPVVLVGLSMGGYVALEFFRRYRGRLRSLVLVDTRAEADSPEAARDREKTAERVLREGSQVVADVMVDKLFAPRAPSELRESWRGIMTATPPAGVAAALRAMRLRPDSTDTLGKIDVPTLIVVGEEDAITPPDCARQMHRAVGNAQLKIVPDSGHMTPVEQPDRFADILRKFIESCGCPSLC
jgi:pimeloyl-ACP methyl ester carboxylesterase